MENAGGGKINKMKTCPNCKKEYSFQIECMIIENRGMCPYCEEKLLAKDKNENVFNENIISGFSAILQGFKSMINENKQNEKL